MTLPQSKRFFVSERYGGYANRSAWIDRIQNPTALAFILTLWFVCAAMIIVGHHSVWFSLINLALCRYFFIQTRWKSILRGMGAPGFMTYWLAACVFFLEYSVHMDPSGSVRPVVLLLFKIDFAAIMLSAGLYKAFSGFPINQGMDYGMANPWWGYWWRWYKGIAPDHLLFRSLNHLAYATEILAAIFLFIPYTQLLGAVLIIGSFLFIATQIRLGFLCEMVMLAAFLYMEPGSVADRMLGMWITTPTKPVATVSEFVHYVNLAMVFFLWAYILILPLAHAGLWYNFLGRKPVPGVCQRILERYTNFFGMIIWRVFTIDLVNFFANIYVLNRESGEKELYSHWRVLDWRRNFRYWHVGEFICLCSLFTTLKYYPSNPGLFQRRLMRYAKTIPCPPGSVVVFEYLSIRKSQDRFEFVPIGEYVVDVYHGSVEEKLLDDRFSVREAHPASPLHEADYPGSYAPPRTS
jgi:hypothetical protein